MCLLLCVICMCSFSRASSTSSWSTGFGSAPSTWCTIIWCHTVSFHNFNSQKNKLSVSNPNKRICCLCVRTVSNFKLPGSRPQKQTWNSENWPYNVISYTSTNINQLSINTSTSHDTHYIWHIQEHSSNIWISLISIAKYSLIKMILAKIVRNFVKSLLECADLLYMSFTINHIYPKWRYDL